MTPAASRLLPIALTQRPKRTRLSTHQARTAATPARMIGIGTPSGRAPTSSFSPGSATMTSWPSVYTSVIPRTITRVAIVAMNGVTLRRVTTRPLNRPTPAPATRPAPIARMVGMPPRISVQVMAPARATTEPTERSNSPITRHIIIARLGMAMMLDWTRRFSRFVGVRNALDITDRTMTSTAERQ